MPRIPAAIAVVMLVGTCIGFNTARFPVVLEMAAVSEPSPETKVVVSSERSADSEGRADRGSTRWDSDREDSSYGEQSSWSSYGSDSGGKSNYNSYNSYGSYGDGENDSDTWDTEDESSSSYGYREHNSSDDSDSYGYGTSSGYGDSYGYGSDDSISDADSESSEEYGYGYGEEKSSDDVSSSVKRNRRNKNRSQGKSSGSLGNPRSYASHSNDDFKSRRNDSWKSSASEDSNQYSEYDPYETDDDDSDGYGTYAQSDPYGSGASTDDRKSNSSDSYGYESSNKRSSSDSYGSSPDPYGEDTHSYGKENNAYDDNDQETWSREDAYASHSSQDNYETVTRYGERQEAAADNSSTWSGGAPVTALPARPYAYGSGSYAGSAAAPANAVSKSNGLGLVPVSDDPQDASPWSNDNSVSSRSSSYAGYRDGGGDRFGSRSQNSSFPAGLIPLPPVDRSMTGPALHSLTNGSIPVYPSTETR